jgi:hypothetical protein
MRSASATGASSFPRIDATPFLCPYLGPYAEMCSVSPTNVILSISQVASSMMVRTRGGVITDHGQVFMNLSFYIESSSVKPSRTLFATAFLVLYHASNTRYTYSRVISGGARTNMRKKGSRPLSFHFSDLPAYSLPIRRSTHKSAKVHNMGDDRQGKMHVPLGRPVYLLGEP